MTSLSTDLSNGVRLCQLMEIMGDVTFPKYNKNPKIRVQKAENVNVALNFIRDRGVVLTNVGAEGEFQVKRGEGIDGKLSCKSKLSGRLCYL